MPEHTDAKLIYAAQIRAARGLLNWSQGELAERAGLVKQTVMRIESGRYDPRLSTASALNRAIRAAGVEMSVDSDGVIRVSLPSARICGEGRA